MIVTIVVLVFFAAPLWLWRREALRHTPGPKKRFLLYFVTIGVGYITLEIVLLQHLTLFLGPPVYALVIVLFSLLVASGLGSRSVVGVGVAQVGSQIMRTTDKSCEMNK